MQRSTTDDFISVEVVNGGAVKTTVNMGAGPVVMFSEQPIFYGEWHYLELERLAHTVTMSLQTDRKGGFIDEDRVTEVLPMFDQFKRPFGSVFNLHPKHSRIFVGGFPNQAGIQDEVRETTMEGQIEGLRIGNEEVGLWNFVDSRNIRGARQRNRFKVKPSQGLKFEGNGYVAVDKYNFVSISSEFEISFSVKLASADGILFCAGSISAGQFVVLEVINGNFVYTINFGEGVSRIVSPKTYQLHVWYDVNLSRDSSSRAVLSVDTEPVGEMEIPSSWALSLDDYMHFGGFPSQGAFSHVTTGNFSGCMKNTFIGLDPVDLASSPERYNVKLGCQEEV
ncbi:Laminin subunit alphalike [Caligus rogercresseyi]|uniref:Laminin subunit alphalike n=1 Tax=Caligus rogercresseyi TaxID=217165 RepID=A0A7T8JV93_CALRO|nr:Laminin subunit alphalike [Caligus rogercresseyi]